MNLVLVNESRRSNQMMFLVVDDEGTNRGIVYKSRNTRSTTFPWQGKRYTGSETLSTGQVVPVTETVEAVYVEGKGCKASNAARDAVIAKILS